MATNSNLSADKTFAHPVICQNRFTTKKLADLGRVLMLQRYDMAINDRTNRLSIKEFAVLETKSHKRNNYQPIQKNYSLVHEVSFDNDIIRAAIKEGQKALISALRSGDFFPISPCIERIAKTVTDLFNDKLAPNFEMFFDDRTLLSTYVEEKD
jgi:hypothetical protein